MSDFDPDAFLKGAPATPETAIKGEKPVSDFNPDAFLSSGKEEISTTKAPDMTPVPQGYLAGPTGISVDAIKQTAAPMVQAGKGALGGYIKNPITAAVDIGAVHMGLPPPYATAETAKGLYNTYGAAKASMNTAQGLASRIAETPGVEASFNKIINALPKADALRMNELINKRGAQGLKEFIESAPDAIKAMPEAKELAGMVPTRGQQAMRVLGPAMRGVAKVAGPAGLAMNAYDAAQYAEASKLGERLAGGQGQLAPAAFHNMATSQNVSGYQLSPTEAANLLSSGDQRTIAIYGGQERLNQIAGGKSPNAAPTANNFIERIKSMAHQYGQIK
jgi:hypothetical protein